jgi:hypothetical protein
MTLSRAVFNEHIHDENASCTTTTRLTRAPSHCNVQNNIRGNTMNPIHKLVAAHTALAEALELSLEPFTLDDDILERGWVAYPLSKSDLQRLEALAGFTFSPLLCALFSTKGAMAPFEEGVFGLSSWCGQDAFEKNQAVVKAREEYDWNLPKLVAIASDEDFYAVTEDHKVVVICGNEGIIEREHGSLEGWLRRYADAVMQRAKNPDDIDVYNEDPEAEHT